MPLPIFALFLAAFAFGTTEFVIAGLLPPVADGLGVDVPSAGYLVSGYAIGIALGGPLLTIATARVERRRLLVTVTAAFTLGQAICAVAPDFVSMLATRVTIGVVHGVFFGVAMVVATSLVPAEQRGRAVALVLAGLTVSNIIGVPVGAAIGNGLGWRATFWAMFALGLASTVAAALLPATRGHSSTGGSLSREFRVLGRQQVWTSLIIMLMLMMGQMIPFTYIAPLLGEVTGLDARLIPWALLLCGVGSTAGVFLGGRLADWTPRRSLIALIVLQVPVLVAFYLASPYPWPMMVVLFVWGGVNFAIGTLVQTRILAWTADAPTIASSLIPAGFNVGIALAAFVGAQMLYAGLGYRALPLLGVGAMALAALVAVFSYRAELSRGRMPPVSVAAE